MLPACHLTPHLQPPRAPATLPTSLRHVYSQFPHLSSWQAAITRGRAARGPAPPLKGSRAPRADQGEARGGRGARGQWLGRRLGPGPRRAEAWRTLRGYSELEWWPMCHNVLPRTPEEPACPRSLGESCFPGLCGPLLTLAPPGAPHHVSPEPAAAFPVPCPPHALLCVWHLWTQRNHQLKWMGILIPLWIRPSFYPFWMLLSSAPWLNSHDHNVPAPSGHAKCSH